MPMILNNSTIAITCQYNEMRAASCNINKFISVAIDICAIRLEIFNFEWLPGHVLVFAQIA